MWAKRCKNGNSGAKDCCCCCCIALHWLLLPLWRIFTKCTRKSISYCCHHVERSFVSPDNLFNFLKQKLNANLDTNHRKIYKPIFSMTFFESFNLGHRLQGPVLKLWILNLHGSFNKTDFCDRKRRKKSFYLVKKLIKFRIRSFRIECWILWAIYLSQD